MQESFASSPFDASPVLKPPGIQVARGGLAASRPRLCRRALYAIGIIDEGTGYQCLQGLSGQVPALSRAR